MVRSGSQTHRKQTGSAPHKASICHCMVMLAARASGHRKESACQNKIATVMLSYLRRRSQFLLTCSPEKLLRSERVSGSVSGPQETPTLPWLRQTLLLIWFARVAFTCRFATIATCIGASSSSLHLKEDAVLANTYVFTMACRFS